MRKIGIGVIGCGAIAERHIAVLRDIPQARLVAVSDINEQTVQDVKERYQAEHAYTDYRKMLERADIDAVFVCTPNFLHAQNTIDAVNAGKHVLVQKPMALDLAEADQMIEAARINNVTLMASFFQRFMGSYNKVKELIEEGRIGRPLLFKTQFSHSGINKYWKPKSDWFYNREKSGGGPLGDLGAHHFDVLRMLTGSEVDEITAVTSTLEDEEAQIEDNASVTLKFKNGMMAQMLMSFTTIAPPQSTLERIEVYGTEGTIIAAPSTSEKPPIKVFRADGEGWTEIRLEQTFHPFKEMEDHFVRCLIEGTQPVTTGEDGKRTLEIIKAGYESARLRRTFKLEELVKQGGATR